MPCLRSVSKKTITTKVKYTREGFHKRDAKHSVNEKTTILLQKNKMKFFERVYVLILFYFPIWICVHRLLASVQYSTTIFKITSKEKKIIKKNRIMEDC